jgi:isopentenyl diphosphate isomerase/L-lactate dehydrogenase-like FMN-dependent dehydrogenase
VLGALGVGVSEPVITERATSENSGALEVSSYLSSELEITLLTLDRVGERLGGARCQDLDLTGA